MKNFTSFGRLLLLAVFLLSAVSLSAQTVCGINGPVTVSAEPACQGGFPSPQPFVVVDLGPGSGLINGPVNVRVQPIYNNIFPGPPVDALGVIANNGIITFETPENSVFSSFNIKIRLIEITIVGSCTQNFENSPIESAPFSMQETSNVQSITRNATRSIDPPCPGVATGRISANLVPTAGPFTATRFSAEIYPGVAFVQVFGPGSGPNTDPNSYLIESTASLEPGDYDIVISDSESTTGCVVVYNATVGDPSTTLTAEAEVQDASCFGVADGSIKVSVSPLIDPLVNGTIFVAYSTGGGTPIQAGQLGVNSNTNRYRSFTITGLAAGTYNVNIISSATECSDDATVSVSEPAEIEVTASADPVCADAGTFDFTLTDISGLDPGARYRLIDATFFDNDGGNNNSCWTRPPSGRDLIAPGLQMDGSYSFTNVLASTPGCYNVNQDTTVTLYLELLNPNGCRDTFSFPLQINAKPITPVVDASADVGGDLINDLYCSGQDIDLDIADYDPAFTYEISYTEVPSVLAGGAAAANDTFPYVDGNTVVSFVNNTDVLATIDFLVTKTNVATGCTSDAGSFSVRIRPEPTLDPISDTEVLVCSAEQFVSEVIGVNGGNNANITYNFAWTLTTPSPDFTFSGQFTGNRQTGTSVSGTFTNTTGSDQTATLTVTPVFVQQNPVIGGGSVDNTCEGMSETITVTVSSRPTLNYDLTIGDLDTMLTGGNVAAFEICNGEDFLLDNLAIPETHAGGKLKYVRYRVRGDARFLQINTNGSNFGPNDIQTTQFLPIGNFAIGQPNIQNNHPDNNAQVAQISLTPYYQTPGTPANQAASQMCAGQRIRLFLTLNPTPPVLPSPQSETVCSDERIEYTIMGASGNGNTLETRITSANVFPGTTDAIFVVPEGANRIEDFRFELTGGNGGGTTTTGGAGGFGAFVTGSLSSMELEPGDTVRIRKGLAGGANNRNGDGGDATFLTVTAGSNHGGMISAGDVIHTFVAAGGGGAGSAMNGSNARTFTNLAAANGMQGQGPGGFGGTGFSGSPVARGGNGNINGGGGGGGWVGGDGGNSASGAPGLGGRSYRSTSTVPASFAQKTDDQLADGQARIFYTVVYDDIRFSLASQNVPAGLTPTGESIVDGEVDTILFGQQFENLTDEDLTVTYVFNTTTEAMCDDGGQVTVEVTVEPTPTLELASSGTMITDNSDGSYAAEICSGDSLSTVLSSMTIPSQGTSVVRARVIDVATSSMDVTFGMGDGGQASASANLAGNNQPSTNDIPFYEASIVNVGDTNGTVTYTVVPYIINTVGSSGMECVGDTLTLTVTVYPEFVGVAPGPIMTGICSNVSLEDAGFDLDVTQGVQIAFDSIIIDTVITAPGGNMNFDTVSSVYSGTPVTVVRSADFFNGDTYRNRTGGPVLVTYEVRLVSGPGCTSDPIRYEFRYAAEPVIDIVESATNQIDTTICSGDMTGLTVTPAANSAFPTTTGANAFQNQITIEYDIIDQPAGLVLSNSTDGYPFVAGRNYFRDDVWTNNTSGPLDVKYSVKVSNGACAGDSVVYTVTVNPNPFAEVMLTALDSTATFGLNNSRLGVSPNPAFGVCSGQAITATVPTVSTSAEGTLMVRFEITTDADGISGYPLSTIYNFPASELADSLSYAAGELVNMTGASQFFTVEYRAYIEANGTPGFQNDGVDCLSDGIVQFDVVVNPANGAIARTELDGTPGAIPVGMDTLCSGDVYDFFVRNLDAAGASVDSFLVEVTDNGLDAVAGTPTGSFTILAPTTSTNAVRLQDFSYVNTTPGIKTVTYVVTPLSGACVGATDTTTISYRAEIDLIANEPVLCSDAGVATSIFAIDANGGMLSTTAGEYRYQYIGGTAFGFSLTTSTGGNLRFVGDPVAQANTIVYNNQLSVTVTPSPNAGAFTPGTVNFQVIYDDATNNCGAVTDTISIMFQTTAEAGTANPGFGIQCDGVNFVLNDALLDEDEGGVFTFTNGDPGLGVLNGANFTPMVGGSDPAPVTIDFTYTVGGGNSGCGTASVDFSVMVEPAPNAGTYDGTVGEACESAAPFNLFDLLEGEMQNGMFSQTAGIDFVTVNADGTIDQSGITPGTYEFTYTVTSPSSNCGSDVVTGITVQVNSDANCSVAIPCDTISLSAGFNIISFDVLPNDAAVRSIFADEIASENLLRVISIRPDVANGMTQTFSFLGADFGSGDNYDGVIAGGIQPGYGYIVQVIAPVTIEVCGVEVDENISVPLQAGTNYIGYVPDAPTATDVFFEQLTTAQDLNFVFGLNNNLGVRRTYGFFSNPNQGFGPLRQLVNGKGYLINVKDDYPLGNWKTEGVRPTTVFDQLYGSIENGQDFAGEDIRFTNSNGDIFGIVTITDKGYYLNASLFGDMAETEIIDGFQSGEEIFVSFRGETYATGITFDGGWSLERLDLNFDQALTPASENLNGELSIITYPNPTEALVNVEINLVDVRNSITLEVFNALGQLVVTKTISRPVVGMNKLSLDLSLVSAGAYQLRITADGGPLGYRQLIRK